MCVKSFSKSQIQNLSSLVVTMVDVMFNFFVFPEGHFLFRQEGQRSRFCSGTAPLEMAGAQRLCCSPTHSSEWTFADMKDGCQVLWVKGSLSLSIANLQPSFILPDGVCVFAL